MRESEDQRKSRRHVSRHSPTISLAITFKDSTIMNELSKSLIGNSAFAPAKTILQALPESTVHAKPTESIPHSIYGEVWHMAFWQEISLDWVEGKPTPVPEHASGGFPSDTVEPWDAVRDRFLAGAQNAAAIANDTDRLEVQVACPTIGAPERTMTVREQLESLAAHNAYHLGRIVLLRQLLNIWPPPDGGFTW
jgi:uncharacterized damage-inducible protein DinB